MVTVRGAPASANKSVLYTVRGTQELVGERERVRVRDRELRAWWDDLQL